MISQEHESSQDQDEAIAENLHSGKKESNPKLDEFKSQFDLQPSAEEKLRFATEFMESALSQTGTPDFRNFWEVRKLCLDLFKENLSPAIRANLWNKYSELSKEARRLKDILDEQSDFAAEQIEIAIQALEDDITHVQQVLSQPLTLELSENIEALNPHLSSYLNIQHELNLLNAQASRINALRKELIKTEMRIRVKNKFFQRLSQAGDKVFPRRKVLIKEISDLFIEDVDQFNKDYFQDEDRMKEHLFALREEIKALQGAAKLFTLNTQAFNQTRTLLSQCWDKLKETDKERKKEIAQKKESFKQNFDEVHQRVESFKAAFTSGDMSVNDAQTQIDEIVAFMRGVELGRDEVKALREEIGQARGLLFEKQRLLDEERQKQEAERDRVRREKYAQFKEKCQAFVVEASKMEIEAINQQKDALVSEMSAFSKLERNEFEKLLKPLKDIISDKKEQALMALPEDSRAALEQLEQLLNQRKERRNQIRQQVETYRKAEGSSGMDFVKAMEFRELVQAEKEKLEKANQAVKEIEDKISELRGE